MNTVVGTGQSRIQKPETRTQKWGIGPDCHGEHSARPPRFGVRYRVWYFEGTAAAATGIGLFAAHGRDDHPPQVLTGTCSVGNSSWACGLGLEGRPAKETYRNNAATMASATSHHVRFIVGRVSDSTMEF